jgi:RNA polymerase sigma factor (sigma-70 family)
METLVPLPLREHGGGPRIVRLLPSSPPLVPILFPDRDVSPDIDRVLTMVAREAQTGDPAARNALYTACEPKIGRFVRRYRVLTTGTGRCPAFDLEDVQQEAFLIFVDLVEDWPGGDSFCAYFLGHFPWELKNAVRRLATANRPGLHVGMGQHPSLLADGTAAAAEATALLQAVAENMPEPDGDILLWRIRDGDGFAEIARRLGTSRRTAMRAWERIAADLRRSLRV